MLDSTKITSKKDSYPVFYRLLLPLFTLLVAEVLILVGSLVLSDANGELDRNARKMVNQQVANRRNFIENNMVKEWADLSRLSQDIDDVLKKLVKKGEVRIEELDKSSEAAEPLLSAITEELITTLYNKKLNGIFVMLNTQELPENGADCPGKPGIYIRDLDPRSTPSVRQSDLLLERAPISVVQKLGIPADSEWQPLFTFDEETAAFYEAIRRPYQFATVSEKIESPRDYGRWSTVPYSLKNDPQLRIAYIQPLVLSDGTVYGLLGVDLMTSYLSSILPYWELSDEDQGSYMLGITQRGVFTPIVVNGPAQQNIFPGDSLNLSRKGTGNSRIEIEGRKYHARGENFTTYSSNTPFVSEKWTLVGLVPESQLYLMSNRMEKLLLITVFMVLTVGFIGALIISQQFSKPIRRLSSEVSRARKKKKGIPRLSMTGISELDNFVQSFIALSREAEEISNKFLQIIEMASVDLGGFKIPEDENEPMFVTDNFFSMFHMEVDTSQMDAKRFRELISEIRNTFVHTDTGNSTLYQIDLPNGDTRYLRVEMNEKEGRYIGLAEDVTTATKEKMLIERERDYDLLTGLFSRRAFYRQAEELFQNPEELGVAALVMLDLDNLKQTNDNFGHYWGDKYIRQAGQCFASSVPEGTICARVSGDEFYILFYGYEAQEPIRAYLEVLANNIRASEFILPNGEITHISATGGVAWYPEDSVHLSDLMQYADFAMYQFKQGKKGSLGDFDLGIYNKAYHLQQKKREFRLLTQKETLVNYHFQPIVSAKTGEVFAYEALMRVDMLTLKNPAEVLDIAKEEGRLGDVEYLTWSRSLACYQKLVEKGLVDEKAMLFVNSIASVSLKEGDFGRLVKKYKNILKRTVVELTETERLNEEAISRKRNTPGFSGMFALDDYGSGYNSEINLLALKPKFIKVDASIIRDVDTMVDKQKIVENICSYAHERDMLIIAEGVETAQELECVLELGADLLQGYFLARPSQLPPLISKAAVEQIRSFSERKIR